MKKNFLEEAEKTVREIAKMMAQKMSVSDEGDPLWYTDKYGRKHPTPCQLERVVWAHRLPCDILDFIKFRIGRRSWPYEEGTCLLKVFEELNERLDDYREAMVATRRLARCINVEYSFWNSPAMGERK